MRSYLSVVTLVTLGSLASCATPPENIKPIKTANTICSPADASRLTALTEEQGKLARDDAIGVLMIGLPVASIGNKVDNKPEIAALKGRCS